MAKPTPALSKDELLLRRIFGEKPLLRRVNPERERKIRDMPALPYFMKNSMSIDSRIGVGLRRKARMARRSRGNLGNICV
jgi:hypothetical protein